MPTWRKLHVKTIDSVDINAMPDDFTRLLWLMLPLVLDSKGRAIDNSAWLRSKVFPMREDVTIEQVEQAVAWYAGRCMLVRYEVDGRHYFHVPTFEKYQGKTDREAASVIPDPVKQAPRKPRQPSATNSRPTHDLVVSRSRLDVDVDVDVDAEVEAEAEEKTPAGVPPAAPIEPSKPKLPVQVQVYLDSGGKLPTGDQTDGTPKRERAMAFICEHVRDEPAALKLWARVVDAYQMQWSPKSYTVMINDYYLRGRVPGQANGGNHGTTGNGGNGGQAKPIQQAAGKSEEQRARDRQLRAERDARRAARVPA